MGQPLPGTTTCKSVPPEYMCSTKWLTAPRLVVQAELCALTFPSHLTNDDWSSCSPTERMKQWGESGIHAHTAQFSIPVKMVAILSDVTAPGVAPSPALQAFYPLSLAS